MEIDKIQAELKNPDFHYRLKAIAALNNYESEVAVPLLTSKLHDSEFLVRTFVARGLGNQQSAESFAALMQIIKFDDTPNVRAEAANSLSLFGRVAVSHLVLAFYQDDHWLVKRSILAAIAEMDCPEELFDICVQGLKDEDFTVQESSVDGLGLLADSSQQTAALSQILTLVNDQSWRIRVRVSYALKRFNQPQAKAALNQLRQDENHRVVGAALEDLLPQ
ncbi:MAG: HEAT repeat domain-containing protein [Nostoc sp.]|uniref:HEAT repeat domain-containing protein n=1 Tax=Nostoc sp. TaxID=1180 RepID=UPI002FF61E99